MNEPKSDAPRSGPPDWLVAVGFAEAVAILIALVTPITPSKTGSDSSLAAYFLVDPSYPEEVLVSFVVVNLMIGVLALLAWFSMWRDRSK